MKDFFNSDENYKLMLESKQTIDRLQKKKAKKIDLLVEMQNNYKAIDRGKHLFEEYSYESFNDKLKIDTLYYKQLLQSLDESLVPDVEKLLIKNFTNIRHIYESINTKPECFSGVTVSILTEGIQNQSRILSKNIHNFFNNKFYSLSVDKREEKYYECCVEECKTIITEGVEPDEAIQFVIKRNIIHELLDNIAFPFAIKSRLNYLMGSEQYGKIFDQNALIEHFNRYNKLNENISKIVVLCV